MINYFLIFFIDIWFPNSTSTIGQKKEQVFQELDRDNDKIISSNEFDRDLK